jgi:hypothetical protein
MFSDFAVKPQVFEFAPPEKLPTTPGFVISTVLPADNAEVKSPLL